MKDKRLWLLLLLIPACALVMYSLDAFKGLTLIAGAMVAAGVMIWPILGIIAVIFAGSCLQIIGSSHLVGLPMSLGKLFGFLTLGSWGLHFLRKRTITYSAQILPLALFLLVILLSAVFEPLRIHGENRVHLGMEGLFRMLQVYLLFFLIANIAGESRRAFKIALVAVTVATAATGLIGLIEYKVPALTISDDTAAAATIGAVVDMYSIPGVAMRRVTGGVGDPNWLAYTAAAALPLNIFFWRRSRTFLLKCLIMMAAGLQTVALILSYTRSGFFGLFAALIYLLWRRRLPIQPMVAVTVLATILSPIWIPPGFIERMLSSRYLKEGSTPARRELLIDAVNAFLEKPFIGHGYGQFGYFYVEQIRHRARSDWADEVENSINRGVETPENVGTHCLYLEIGVEYGLIGLIPFLLFLAASRKDLLIAEKVGTPEDRDLAIVLTACVLCIAVCGIFGHIKVLKMIWIITGLAAALRRVVLSEKANSSIAMEGTG
jgi:O-antigen ligase